jgi:hypothetical protein
MESVRGAHAQGADLPAPFGHHPNPFCWPQVAAIMGEHGGCCGGHGQAEAMEMPEHVEGDAQMAGESCGEGCGCGHASPFSEVEGATMQGFLSGLYASTMDHPQLLAYLQAMGSEEGSEFAKPAQMLADAMSEVPLQGAKPVHVRLLELVSGQEI